MPSRLRVWECAWGGSSPAFLPQAVVGRGETDAEGKYAVTKENVSCTPETFEIGFTIPDGYRLLTDGEYLFVVQCVEDVQVFDFQFEPI